MIGYSPVHFGQIQLICLKETGNRKVCLNQLRAAVRGLPLSGRSYLDSPSPKSLTEDVSFRMLLFRHNAFGCILLCRQPLHLTPLTKQTVNC